MSREEFDVFWQWYSKGPPQQQEINIAVRAKLRPYAKKFLGIELD